MKKYFVEATHKTPQISLEADKGLIEIKGRSTPEDADKIYEDAMKWIDKYLDKPKDKTIVNFHFEYINSSTTRVLMKLINKFLVAYKSKDTLVEINWLYCDDDMLEYGEDFEELSKIKFNFVNIEYPEIDLDDMFDLD